MRCEAIIKWMRDDGGGGGGGGSDLFCARISIRFYWEPYCFKVN